MEEDDDNPFAGERWLGDHRRYDAYKRGQENPSPETVKKIVNKFREALKEELEAYAKTTVDDATIVEHAFWLIDTLHIEEEKEKPEMVGGFDW